MYTTSYAPKFGTQTRVWEKKHAWATNLFVMAWFALTGVKAIQSFSFPDMPTDTVTISRQGIDSNYRLNSLIQRMEDSRQTGQPLSNEELGQTIAELVRISEQENIQNQEIQERLASLEKQLHEMDHDSIWDGYIVLLTGLLGLMAVIHTALLRQRVSGLELSQNQTPGGMSSALLETKDNPAV